MTDILGLWWVKPLAISLAIIGLFGTGYYKGYQHEKVTFDNYKVTIEALNKVADEHNKIVMQEQTKVTSDIIVDRDKSLKQLKDYYETHHRVIATPAHGLQHHPDSSEVSSIPSATIKLDAVAEVNQPSADGVTTLDCAEDVLQLLTLQKWLTQQYQLN